MTEPTPTPEVQIAMNPEAESVPLAVLQEVFRSIKEFVDLAAENIPEAAGIMEAFEESRILIGFSKEQEAETFAYHYDPTGESAVWPEVQPGCRPVASWDSGISTGCHQTLYMRPDGTFFWTEP